MMAFYSQMDVIRRQLDDGGTPEEKDAAASDRYMAEARALAADMGVTVCDCYSAWKKRAEGEDTTMLLANRINHPLREMHALFADMLFDTVFGK